MVSLRRLPTVCALLVFCRSIAWADSGPVEVVKKLNSGLEGVLRQSAQLDYRARYERLTPVLADAFDFEFMASQAVGKQWDELSPADRSRWVTAFRDLTNATYASRFNNYSGQSFETLGEDDAPHETVFVHSRVIDPGHENVDLDYRMKQSDGRWKVIDVYLKGSVSEIALRRSEYSAGL